MTTTGCVFYFVFTYLPPPSPQTNDHTLTELNLNNNTKLDSDLIDELIVALTDNIHLEKLQLANVRFTEDHAFVSLSVALMLACACVPADGLLREMVVGLYS